MQADLEWGLFPGGGSTWNPNQQAFTSKFVTATLKNNGTSRFAIKGSDIHGFGDAVFFVTVQILTVSSQIKNPVTSDGKILDVILEVWAIFVMTAVAGSFSAFFAKGDRA